jgi:DNA-binding PadR family transcriptional regulator
MRNDCGCDMRGMLSFQILHLLSKRPMHGDEIAQEIGKRRGEKPTAGTIYPALKELKNKRLIKGGKKGKTIVYSLTPRGKTAVRNARAYFVRCFADVFRNSS